MRESKDKLKKVAEDIYLSQKGDSTQLDHILPKIGDSLTGGRIALVIAGNANASTSGIGKQNQAMSQKAGKRLEHIRHALRKVGEGKDKVASVASYGFFPMKPFFQTEDGKAQCASANQVRLYDVAMPALKKGRSPTPDQRKEAYLTILNLLVYACLDGVSVLSMPLIGAGNYHWEPAEIVALIHLAYEDLDSKPTMRLPTIYLHGYGAKGLESAAFGAQLEALNKSHPFEQGFDSFQKKESAPIDRALGIVCARIRQQYQANVVWDGVTVRLPELNKRGKKFHLDVEEHCVETTHPKVLSQYEKQAHLLKNGLRRFLQPIVKDYSGTPLGNVARFHWNRTKTNVAEAKALQAMLSEEGAETNFIKAIEEALLKLLNDSSLNPVGDWRLALAVMLRGIRASSHVNALGIFEIDDGEFKAFEPRAIRTVPPTPSPAPGLGGGGGGSSR